MHAQRLERPIGARDHMYIAIAAHQDGHFTILRAALARRSKNLFRMFEECAHKTSYRAHSGNFEFESMLQNRVAAVRKTREIAIRAEKRHKARAMTKTVSVIGIETTEIHWIRLLVSLLRHPDPSMPELTREALLYLADTARNREPSVSPSLDQAG